LGCCSVRPIEAEAPKQPDAATRVVAVAAPIPDVDLGSTIFKPSESVTLTWNNVDFVVGDDKKILRGCWGEASAGRSVAVMGPSGAGKTSLLNALAGRSPKSQVTGTFTANGTPITPSDYRTKVAYVMQDDALMATATPREALQFSASLRLPQDMSKKDIDHRVEQMIRELGLDACADTMVGNAMIQGLSGGEKKRVSIGVEMITNPNVLFLDEPTSGLDAFSAYNVVSLLRRVARAPSSVLCTIHQPSSEVFQLFDDVILLKAGRIVYQGPTSSAAAHFAGAGFPCPVSYNPADHIMFVAQKESEQSMDEAGLFMLPRMQLLQPPQSPAGRADPGLRVGAGLLKQMYALTCREGVNISRDVGALIGRFGITIFLNLLYALIFFQAGGKDDSDFSNFTTHFGSMTMLMIGAMFGGAQPTMLQFPFERPMFLREASTGTYSSTAYFISKTATELPLAFLQSVVTWLIAYWLMECNAPFIVLVLISWALGIAGSSVGMALGCAVPDVKTVTEFGPILFVPQILFAGFFVKSSQIPIFLRWAQYLCSLKYAMNLLIIAEFDAANSNCQGGAAANCVQLIQENDVELDHGWAYAGVLVALFVGFRVLGAVILHHKAQSFY